jgi:HEAT repeat protein
MSEGASSGVAAAAGGRSTGRAHLALLLAVLGVLLLADRLRHAAETAAGPRYEGVPLAEWLRQAASENPRDRLTAELALGHIGPEALPTLVRAVEARDSWLWRQWQAMRTKVFKRPARTSPHPALNRVAAGLLARLGPAASNAAPALLRWGARQDGDQFEAARALRAMGPAAAPCLVEALQARDPRLRLTAVQIAADPVFRPAAAALRPGLLKLLEEGSSERRMAAIHALSVLCPDDHAVSARVAALLSVPDLPTLEAALKALVVFGELAGEFAGRVEPLLAAPEPRLRLAAAQALYALRPPAPEAVPVLIQLLRDPRYQWEAARSLGKMGTNAVLAIEELLAQLERTPTHRPSRTPSFAALALQQMSPLAVPRLVHLLEHPASEVRINAAVALTGYGRAAAPAVPGLIRMLGAEDPEEQMTAANTLGALGDTAREALPALERLARLETTQDVVVGHVRSAARAALTNITRTPRGRVLTKSSALPTPPN